MCGRWEGRKTVKDERREGGGWEKREGGRMGRRGVT